MGDWRSRIVEALNAGGCSSQTEWVDKHPGEHCWFRFRDDDFDSCACCGRVRRRDNKNKPCRGVVTIELRG